MPDVPVDLLVRLDRALGVQELLRGIAHDLRNNLQVLTLGSSVDGAEIESRVERAIDEMSETLQILGQLGRRLDSDPPLASPGAVLALVARLADYQRNLPTATLELQYAADLPAVAIGQASLLQILLDLVMWAKEATRPEGGRVTVMAAAVPGDVAIEFVVLARRSGSPGQAPPPGAAAADLGLQVARALVTQAGGDFRLDPNPDGGQITVRLPVAGRSTARY